MSSPLNMRALIATMSLGSLLLGAPLAWAQEDAGAKKKPYINAYDELNRANQLAAAGGFTRAIPHYERALEGDPINYAVAHFNLAEVYRAKKQCKKAGFHYQAYLAVGKDADTRRLADQGSKQCGLDTWPRLNVKARPEGQAELRVNGFLFAQGRDIVDQPLPAGDYKVEATLNDHHPASVDIPLSKNPDPITLTLKKMTFFGTLSITVDQPGATVVITPKQIEHAEQEVQAMTLTSPLEPIKLPTGKYFIEINRPGFDRWIRNVQVGRDSDTGVQVRLTKSLPAEIQVK